MATLTFNIMDRASSRKCVVRVRVRLRVSLLGLGLVHYPQRTQLGLGLVHYPQRTQRTFRSNFVRALFTTPS